MGRDGGVTWTRELRVVRTVPLDLGATMVLMEWWEDIRTALCEKVNPPLTEVVLLVEFFFLNFYDEDPTKSAQWLQA